MGKRSLSLKDPGESKELGGVDKVMNMEWEKYAEKAPHFIEGNVPKLLEKLLKWLNNPYSVIDLGCGDGAILWGGT